MLWRSASFHNLELLAMQQNMARMLDTSRFAIVAAGEHVWTPGPRPEGPESDRPVPVDLPPGRQRRGRLEIGRPARLRHVRPGRPAAPGRRQALHRGQEPGEPAAAAGPAAAVRPGDPAPRRQGPLEDRGRHVPPGPAVLLLRTCRDTSPQPRLVYRAGAIYVDTHVGVLARLDAESGAFDWGYGYKTDPVPVRIPVLLLRSAAGAAGRRRPAARRPARRSSSRGCSPTGSMPSSPTG